MSRFFIVKGLWITNIPNVDLLLLGVGALVVYRRRVHIAFVLVCVDWIDQKVSILFLVFLFYYFTKYQVSLGAIGTVVAIFSFQILRNVLSPCLFRWSYIDHCCISGLQRIIETFQQTFHHSKVVRNFMQWY